MAKPKRSSADLDAELAALEAELAALEGKRKAPPKAAPPPSPAKPTPKREAESGELAETPQDSASSAPSASDINASKKRFGFRLPSRKPKEGPAPEPMPTLTPAPAPVAPQHAAPSPRPAAPVRPVIPDTSALAPYWRREGDAWVRTVPGGTRTIRRVLDENGNVVREEPADAREADRTSAMKAERGAGKLLGRFRK